MIDWLKSLSPWQIVLLVVVTIVVVNVIVVLITRALVRRGLRTPWVIERLGRLTGWFVDLIKRPITVAVLDEVADVIKVGHYTQNISAAIVANHDELVALVAEKVREDPSARLVSRIPGYDAIVGQVSETTLRVVVEMLGDPRMDELVADLLRNNLDQIKRAVRDRQPAAAPRPPVAPPPPGMSPMVGPEPR